MKRVLSLALSVLLLLSMMDAFSSKGENNKETSFCRCQPNQPCWPNQKAWSGLAKQLTGRLVKNPVSPIAPCRKDAKSKACVRALKLLKNPVYLQTMPGGSESQGYWKAWTYKNSTYAVEAENTKDIVAAVNFARKHHLKLVIKGAGHDYLGRSNAPNSLLIWTHHLQTLNYHKSFKPAGAPAKSKGVSAITVGAGVVWLQAYQKVTQYGQYVQGGGCTTVGAAGGFTLGGGFGSWSKKFGTGAANLLQAKIVMADGRVLTANAYQNKDLFWALRGGGFGLGVVTQMTYRTYPLPKYFGDVEGEIAAKNDAAYKQLIQHLLVFLRGHIINEHWGEQVRFHANNTITLSLSSQELPKAAESIWLPFIEWLRNHPQLYTWKIAFSQMPSKDKWSTSHYEKYSKQDIVLNELPGAGKGLWWWGGNTGEASVYWTSYQSWWLPLNLFEKKNINRLADVVFKASRYAKNSGFELHLNKGLAGASAGAIQRGRETSMNPAVYKAAGLIIMGAYTQSYPGVQGHSPKMMAKQLNATAQDITQGMQLIKKLAPNAGSYVNETDYFEPHWQSVFWGANYPRLLKIKQEYDPNGLFYCHHCVGSEFWQKGGMCRIPVAKTSS